MRGFVRVLEPAPTTHVVDEDFPKLAVSGEDITQQTPKAWPIPYLKSTLTGVGVRGDHFEAMSRSVAVNAISLGRKGIRLIFGRHSQVLSGGNHDVRCHGKEILRAEKACRDKSFPQPVATKL